MNTTMAGQGSPSEPVEDVSSRTFNPTYRTIRHDYPAVELLWTSLFPAKPDKVKIRKHFTFFPIKFTLKAEYDTRNRTFEYGASARVRLMSADVVKII